MIFPGAGGFDKLDEIKTERMLTVPMLEAYRADLLESVPYSKKMIALLKDTIKDLEAIGDNKMSEREKEECDLCKKYLDSQIRSVKDSEDTIIIIGNYLKLLKGEVAG